MELQWKRNLRCAAPRGGRVASRGQRTQAPHPHPTPAPAGAPLQEHGTQHFPAAPQHALFSPCQEMGVGHVERCKGFSAHLTKVLIRQRRSLTTLTEQWILLRYR